MGYSFHNGLHERPLMSTRRYIILEILTLVSFVAMLCAAAYYWGGQ